MRNGLVGPVTTSMDAINLEKAEVLKGPSATLYGINVLASVRYESNQFNGGKRGQAAVAAYSQSAWSPKFGFCTINCRLICSNNTKFCICSNSCCCNLGLDYKNSYMGSGLYTTARVRNLFGQVNVKINDNIRSSTNISNPEDGHVLFALKS